MKELITYPLNDVDYSAEDAGLFHCTRTSGVWHKDSFPINVSGADNTVTIGKGLAWFSNDEFWGKVAAQKTVVELDLEYADPAYDRIDVIALQFDANKNATNLIVKKGEAKTNPTIPAISRTEALYELYLYAITRPAASVTIASSNVRDLRLDDEYCGLMADSVTSLDFPIVPVEKGGTGANTPEEALSNLGGGSITKLWENPKPLSAFEKQDIVLENVYYDFLDFVFVESKSSKNLNTIRVALSKTVYDESAPLNSALIVHNGATTSFRSIQIKPEVLGIWDLSKLTIIIFESYIKKLSVSDGNIKTTSTNNNEACIPVAIYGIKGVL